MNAFDLALAFTLPAEGGYVDNPADPGGATNCGITQGTYDTWRDIQMQPRRPVSLLTDAEKVAIYQGNYWTPGKCAQLPQAVAIVHFDWCVNHGVQGAIKTLQQAVGVPVDGVAGPQTLIAAEATDPLATAKAYNELRRQWYRDRVAARPDQGVFLKGWLERVDHLDAYVEKPT